MKKLFMFIAIVGFFCIAPTLNVSAEEEDPCATEILECPDGTQFYAIVCDDDDRRVFIKTLCGSGIL
jgi:hypothetical protein